MGNINAATYRTAMQSYFENFGAVDRCYCTTGKETNKNQVLWSSEQRPRRTRSRELGPMHLWDMW